MSDVCLIFIASGVYLIVMICTVLSVTLIVNFGHPYSAYKMVLLFVSLYARLPY